MAPFLSMRATRLTGCITLVICAVLATPDRSFAAADAPLDVVSLRVPDGRVHAVLTGAGTAVPHRDILICADQVDGAAPGEKTCTLFQPSGNDTSYAPAATSSVTLPAAVVALQWADLDNTGAEQLFSLTRSGILAYRDGIASPPVPVLEREVLVPPGTTHVQHGNFLVDLNNDGRLDILAPVAEGLAFHAQDEVGAFGRAPTAVLAYPVIARGQAFGGGARESLGGSRRYLGDANGDGRTDVFVLDPFGSYRFVQQVDGTFIREQIAASLHEEDGTTSYLDMYGDWNGDQHPDAAFTRFQQGRLMNTTLDIHLSSNTGTIPTQPSLRMAEAGNVVFPIFLDATGNGKSELLLYRLQFGIRFALNYFLRNRILIDASVFELNGDGVYSATPSVRTSLALEVVEGGGEPARAAADINGDGAMDMVVGLGAQKLAVYLGHRKRILATQPEWIVPVEAFGIAGSADLNGDGRDDILLRYPQKESETLVNLVLTRPGQS